MYNWKILMIGSAIVVAYFVTVLANGILTP
jgi:hypothetical protein